MALDGEGHRVAISSWGFLSNNMDRFYPQIHVYDYSGNIDTWVLFGNLSPSNSGYYGDTIQLNYNGTIMVTGYGETSISILPV